jgi:hypothetical protein
MAAITQASSLSAEPCRARTVMALPAILPDHPSNHCLVHVTPAPVLAGLEGLDDGVTALMEMMCRVPMGRGIAAADMTACQTQAQMHPNSTDPQAIRAAICIGRHPPNRA